MSVPPVKRKLAAILSADVKGYSRLMQEDEVGTVRNHVKEAKPLSPIPKPASWERPGPQGARKAPRKPN